MLCRRYTAKRTVGQKHDAYKIGTKCKAEKSPVFNIPSVKKGGGQQTSSQVVATSRDYVNP